MAMLLMPNRLYLLTNQKHQFALNWDERWKHNNMRNNVFEKHKISFYSGLQGILDVFSTAFKRHFYVCIVSNDTIGLQRWKKSFVFTTRHKKIFRIIIFIVFYLNLIYRNVARNSYLYCSGFLNWKGSSGTHTHEILDINLFFVERLFNCAKISNLKKNFYWH